MENIYSCLPNKLSSPETFPHHVLLLFYPFRDEKELLSGFPPLYQNQLQERGVQDVVNTIRIKSELHGDLVDQAHSRFNLSMINNQDPHRLKTTNHQRQMISMKLMHKTQKKTTLLEFLTLYHKY